MTDTAVALLRELHEREKQLARKLASPGTPQRDLHDRIEALLSNTVTTATMPPVGPLTSTENLLPGDIVREPNGNLIAVRTVHSDYVELDRPGGDEGSLAGLAFVARPGAWMPWTATATSENPVPGMTVSVKGRHNNTTATKHSDDLKWSTRVTNHITEYMVVAEPSRDVESLADLLNSGAVRPDKPGSKRLVPTEDPSRDDHSNIRNFGTLADQPLDGVKAEDCRAAEPSRDQALADRIRDHLAKVNIAVRELGQMGVTVEFDNQHLTGMRVPTNLVRASIRRIL